MNKNNNNRRSLIKRGLTLIGGIFFFGAVRSFGAVTKPSAPNAKGPIVRKARGRTQHCIEGVSLGSPV
jgi:hypothetical protein